MLSFSFFISSCSDEVEQGKRGDGKHIQIALSVPQKAIVTPLTKSGELESSNKVSSLDILVYKDGQLQQTESKSINGDDQKLTALSEGQSVNYLLDIKSGGSADNNRKVYIIANVENLNYAEVGTIDDLKALSFATDGVNPELIMVGGEYNCSPTGNALVEAKLTRIYSMVTVKIDNQLDRNKNIEITPISLKLMNVPKNGNLFQENKITSSNESQSGYSISNDAGIDLSDHKDAIPFYLYENLQPDGKNAGGGQKDKTPADYDLGTPESVIKSSEKKCSYIEVEALYIKNGAPHGAGSGTITYRFFLGEDAVNNFQVFRNTWYKITLTLHGDGGKDENTWRVDTDLLQDVTIDDLYVGYRVGSKSELVIHGEVGQDFKITGVTSDDKIDGKERFLYEGEQNGKYYVKAQYTNTHDFDKKLGTITYITGGNTKTANVYQVPRLVDPIAVYKHSSNDATTEIVVKEYIPKKNGDKKNGVVKNGYYTLTSQGAWSATVELGDWITLSTEKDGTGSQSIESGGGEDNKVIFYMHNGKSTGAPRYGKITVMYHNKNCKHEIFVRQGGYDKDKNDETTIGGTSWSIFNCTGKDAFGNMGITTSPTQTGWFFKGGFNEGMNPYSPEYLKNSTPVWSVTPSEDHWDALKGDWDDDFTGPCPNGYKIASLDDYYSLVDNTEIYLGFVHDDVGAEGNYTRNSTNADPVGWHYDGQNNMVVNDNNYCNPAKGSLFAMADGTNVFFTYGKGVLVRTDNNAADYINEIGVGYRGGGSGKFILNYNYEHMEIPNGSYGGIYYTSTPGHAYGNYWGKADFGYNLSQARYKLDTKEKDGLQGQFHGCFVRCVRDNTSQPSGNKKVNVNAEFKYRKNERSSFEEIKKETISVYDQSMTNKLADFITDDDGEFEGEIKLPSEAQIIYFYYKGIFSIAEVSDLGRELTYRFAGTEEDLGSKKVKATFYYGSKNDWNLIKKGNIIIYYSGNYYNKFTTDNNGKVNDFTIELSKEEYVELSFYDNKKNYTVKCSVASLLDKSKEIYLKKD